MGIVLCKAAHTHQTMKLAALLMAVDQTQLAHTKGQVAVGMRLVLIHQHAARTVHGLNRIILLINDGCVHIILIVIPVTGIFPQLTAQYNGGGNLLVSFPLMDFTPVVNQRILKGHTLWQEKRETRTFLSKHEQAQFLAQLPVVALLSLLHHGKVIL